MQRILALRFAGALILALAACVEAPKAEGAPILDEELERAVSCGLVSSEELSDLEETVTYSRFCGLLSKVVAMRSEDFVPAWEELAAALVDAGLDPADGPCLVVKEMLESFRKYTIG